MGTSFDSIASGVTSTRCGVPFLSHGASLPAAVVVATVCELAVASACRDGGGGAFGVVRCGDVLRCLGQGELDVEIAGSFPLADVAGAFAQSMSGTTRGKLVIHVAD